MSALSYLPLFVALGSVAIVSLSIVSDRIDGTVTGLALHLFRDAIEEHGRKKPKKKRLLHAIHSSATYPAYAAKTALFAIVAGVASTVIGAYAGHAFLRFLIAHREAIRSTLPEQLHFIVARKPLLSPIERLGGLGASDGGGIGILLGLPDPIGRLVSRSVWHVIVTIVSMVLGALRPSIPDRVMVSPSDGGVAENVEVVITVRWNLLPDSIATLSLGQLSLLVFVSLAFGAVIAVGVYYLRWYLVRNAARNREVAIDESLARTIAFIYALSRSGMAYPEIVRIVGRNREIFGESAEEVGVVVKDMDLFGTDLVTALRQGARRTPSEQFSDFADNFANVLQSGQNVSEYLRGQYDQYRRERVANRERLLELFTALGETYVAVFVAGPLFLITILATFGLLMGGLIAMIRMIVYVWIPVSNAGFMLYLANIVQPLTAYRAPIRKRAERRPLTVRRVDDPGARDGTVADGGTVAVDAERNLRRLEAYNRIRRVKQAVKTPLRTLVSNPETLLYVTVPLAVAWLFVRWQFGGPGEITIETLDDWLVQSALFVAGTFAVVQEINTRRLRSIETVIPDFLESLASSNEAGMTLTESLKRMDESDFGILNTELEYLLADIQWGARVERALYRFNDRIGSSTIARIVALITNAMRASDHIGPVIRIAADEARKDRRLKEKLRQEMLMYVVIVYLSFFVFFGIVVALETILVPAIPSAEQMGGFGGGGAVGIRIAISPVRQAVKDAYTLVLFHAAIVQAVVSGFVAGQIGEGNIENGAKHVTIMLAIAYGIFLLFG